MAAGSPDAPQLNAGLSAQQLVTPMAPVLNTDAVSALVDAYHKGIITAGDINDRIGAVAQANKRAHLQQLSEFVSPEAIQSRMSQYQAQGATAGLQAAQAGAALPLVQPQADLAATKLAAEQASTVYGAGGMTAIQTLGPWYGVGMEDFRNPKTGQIDFAKASQAGNEIAAKNAIINNWFDRLTPAKEEDVTDANGQTLHVTYNKFGQVVSPPNPQLGYKGSDTYWYVVDQLHNLMPDTHPLRGAIPSGDHPIKANEDYHSGDGPVTNSTQAAPTIQITPNNENAYRAKYMDYLKGQGAEEDEARKMASGADKSLIQLFANETAPTIEPATTATTATTATPTTPTVAPADAAALVGGVGPVIKPAQTPVEKRKEILSARSELRKLPDLDEYYKALPTYTKFADSARRAPVANNGPTDLGLAENYSKMHDPTSTLREFKFDALTKVIPLLEKFKDAKAMIDREHIFPPEVRKAIIEDGMRTVDAAEKAIIPSLQAAEQTLPGTLDAEQQQIVKGIPFSQRRGHVYGGAAGAGTLQTLPSGRRVMWVPNP